MMMKNVKPSRRATLLVCSGLLISILPMLFKEYVPMADFTRGALQGAGLGLEISGLILMGRHRRCAMRSAEDDTVVGE